MSIPYSMMNDEIKNSAYYMTYLALSTNTKVPKGVKGKFKGLMSKKNPDTVVHKEKKKAHVKKKDDVQRKKRSITADDNILPDPDEALKLALDHSQKLKGIETLSAAAQLVSDLKTTTKASKLDYRIQQQSHGSSEAVGIILEVLNELKDISGSSSSLSTGSDNETKEISNDEEVKVDEHNAEEEKEIEEQTRDEQPFINKNHDVSIDDILKDSTDREIQSMVDVPILQEDSVVQRTPLVDNVVSMVTEKSTPTPPLPTTEA
nr:hypothetical protein [Tanacetum cinerariifolium]